MAGKLFLVGTPIGNLSDFSPRAVETLMNADFIAAEDTRVTMKLLNHFDIHKPLVSYYEHNKHYSGEKILNRIIDGEICALVTDAGMPGISDPGEDLALLCEQHNIEVTTIPGPTALITALVLSGLNTGRFCFEGFLSTANKGRLSHLDSVKNEKRTMIFYEAPHKLKKTLIDFKATFGGTRKIALCRELTKIHEDVMRTTIDEAIEYYNNNEPRGEYVLIIEGKSENDEETIPEGNALEMVFSLRSEGYSLKDACKQIAAETGYPKNVLYQKAIEQNKS